MFFQPNEYEHLLQGGPSLYLCQQRSFSCHCMPSNLTSTRIQRPISNAKWLIRAFTISPKLSQRDSWHPCKVPWSSCSAIKPKHTPCHLTGERKIACRCQESPDLCNHYTATLNPGINVLLFSSANVLNTSKLQGKQCKRNLCNMLLAEDKKQLFRKQLFWHKTMLMCNKKAKCFRTNTQLSVHPNCKEKKKCSFHIAVSKIYSWRSNLPVCFCFNGWISQNNSRTCPARSYFTIQSKERNDQGYCYYSYWLTRLLRLVNILPC